MSVISAYCKKLQKLTAKFCFNVITYSCNDMIYDHGAKISNYISNPATADAIEASHRFRF